MTRKVTECDLNKMQAEKHLYSSIAKPVAKPAIAPVYVDNSLKAKLLRAVDVIFKKIGM